MRIIRAALAAIGTVYDILVPPKIIDHVTAASRTPESRGDSPEAVSARTPLTAAPASGHPSTAATPRAAATDPGLADPPSASPGSPPQVFTLIRGAGATEPAPERDHFDWVLWVIPAITKAMRRHIPQQLADGEILCARADEAPCAYLATWDEWIDHVAPTVAAGIHAAAAKQ